MEEGMVYLSLALCWEPKWCQCLSKGQETGADFEMKPFLRGCEEVGTLLPPGLAAQRPENSSTTPWHNQWGDSSNSPLSRVKLGEPMPRGAGELVLLFSCHLHWGEGRRNHCHYSCLTAGNSCLSSVQSALKQRAECVINVLKGRCKLNTETFPGALHAALIAEKRFSRYLCEVRKMLKWFWVPLFVIVPTVECLMTVTALLLRF